VPKALLELGKVPLLERQSVLGVFGGMLREVSLRHEDRRLGTLQPALQATELVLRCSPHTSSQYTFGRPVAGCSSGPAPLAHVCLMGFLRCFAMIRS
jgi:hypothetical protein